MIGPFDTPDLVHCRYCGEPSDGAVVLIVHGGAFHACEGQREALMRDGYTHDDDGESLSASDDRKGNGKP